MLERYQSGDIITFQYCPVSGHKLPSPVNVRVLKVDLAVDANEKTFRNLGIRRAEDKHPLENIPDCENAQFFFNYKKGEKGVMRRIVLCAGEG